MSHTKQAIGILGGTFDPIHFGHLRTALELYQTLNLAEVRLIPCYQPVHRKMPVATPEQRLAMVQAAVALEPGLKADPIEIERRGPSYTIDTLMALRAKTDNTPFCIIMGIDALLNFPSWHKWEEILDLAHLVVVHRPQYQLPQIGIVAELLEQRLITNADHLHNALAGNILLQPVTPLEISATDIRKLIAKSLSPRFLLPDSVYHHIQLHGIYRGQA